MSHPRVWAVCIVRQSVILKTPKKHLTLNEAKAFTKAYNRITDDRVAVVVRHPLQRALAARTSRTPTAGRKLLTIEIR